MSEYRKRDICKNTKLSELFWKHMGAIDRENLTAKQDIASELAYRDKIIYDLKQILRGVGVFDNFTDEF